MARLDSTLGWLSSFLLLPSFMPLDDWSIPGTLWLPALDTHTHPLVINSCTSPGMLWWKWLHDTVSPGPLGYAGEVGLRAVLSLDRDPPGLCCGGNSPMVGHALHCGAVKATRCLQPAQGQWPQLRAWLWLLPQRGKVCGEGSGWREEEWIMLFPADSTALSCFLLS